MKTALISVGTELLMGQTVNTNVVYLSQELNMIGIDVLYHHTVGDNPERLQELIELAYHDCEMVITTGGLGPTQDDLTKEIVCRCHGDELVLHQPSLDAMNGMFDKMKMHITENNYKQCYMPSRATVFDNDQGTAPGFALETDGRIAICMPGPPREMKAMYQRRVKPYLEGRSDGVLFFRDIRCFGIGESQLETTMRPMIDGQTNPTFATYAKEGESFLRIAAKGETRSAAQKLVDDRLPQVRKLIGRFIYSIDGEDLPEVVGKLLLENDVSISCAESCTGGLFAATLIDLPGISRVFERGIVSYSNRAKMEELGVSGDTLEKFGAVSEETAAEMAEGLFEKTGSDLCISVTGVAGPDGGTAEKPVGLAYIGYTWKGETCVVKHQMRNVSRKWNRNRAMLAMMNVVYKVLGEDYEEQ
ncbi:MAG: competence/damage-inducible protein A [Eubacteriaceae bacterium]|nr:competence/damage-inducible protein A [Eubacteriaceae bacterium]